MQRHSVLVRVTHWINAAAFLALVISGLAILLAYPRLHWGNDGSLGMPSLLDLPLPFVLEWGIRGPGRSLHFLAAWLFLFNGLIYVGAGLWTGHFRNDLLPTISKVTLKSLTTHLLLRGDRSAELGRYNPLQQIAYSIVVFILFPFMFATGLAMSPAVTSTFPSLESVFGGHQSARTIHFFVTNLLLLFFIGHMLLLTLSGFWKRSRAMITGFHASPRKAS